MLQQRYSTLLIRILVRVLVLALIFPLALELVACLSPLWKSGKYGNLENMENLGNLENLGDPENMEIAQHFTDTNICTSTSTGSLHSNSSTF